MQNNTAQVGEVLPLNAPRTPQSAQELWQKSCDKAAKEAPHKSASEWVDDLQAQLQSGKQNSLNIIFAGLDPNIKKAIYLAAHLKRGDLSKNLSELTGAQRQQVFIALQRFEQIIVQLQKSGVFALASWNIGQRAPLQPAEQEEIDRITALKNVRYDQQRQLHNQQHEITEEPPLQRQG